MNFLLVLKVSKNEFTLNYTVLFCNTLFKSMLYFIFTRVGVCYVTARVFGTVARALLDAFSKVFWEDA